MYLKNIAKSSVEEILLEDGFSIITYHNESMDMEAAERNIDSSYIQFHFCNKGSATFVFNQGNYRLDINKDMSCLLHPLLIVFI